MRAISVTQYGGPEELKVVDAAAPEPGPGELLVETAAIGVNFIETYQRSGIYAVPLPFTPGAEAAGRVIGVGDGVTRFSVGDRIATADAARTYAESFVVSEQKALAVPDAIDDVTAAALPLQGITAHYLARSVFAAGPDHTVLVHAGAGGVGLLLTQLLSAAGARVITTVGSPHKEHLSRDAGADVVLRYEGFAGAVRELTGGRGVDAVYDGVGKDTFDDSLASLAVRGMLVLFGAASGPVPPVDPQRLNSGGSLLLTRPSIAHFLTTPDERAWRSEEIFGLAASGDLTVRIGGTYSLAEAENAHIDLQSRATTGKLVLVP
ncbi:quinone oxidoreductase family protein [Amnibacterium flavum]|uniref:NADPH:quinone reductase n=1 Tax=Amnibacterium flavum TaxID=2173173 RepID=A0A2V1HUK9_9MICO|nr:quinone oxidoreductase [Amnibacterium flavum]PVZ96306.1 NADPH:quinone reductase [Amnibacterium flavum]